MLQSMRLHRSNRLRKQRGFTLLEVLVATAITLVMMISLAQVFKVIGDSMKQGRAALQINNTLRSIAYRIRNDLNNLTVRLDPPTDSSNGTGYFAYFDGGLCDYSFTLYDPNNGNEYPKVSTDLIRSSRFGDLDDVLMYTVRAGDSWFTGKVPQFILNGTNPANANDLAMVTISAQHAEVAVFVRPIDLNLDGIYDDADSDGLPDGYQLYYRALLVRPDLNDPPGVTGDNMLPFRGTSDPWLIAYNGSTTPSATDMALAHQQCDLSLRRVCTGNFASTGFDRVAANSLEDLMDPANRFAHVRMPVPGTRSTTMPVLALDAGVTSILNKTSAPAPLWTNNSGATTPLGISNGFIARHFVLGQYPGQTVDDDRLGEDVFGSDILAFDVRGFDPAVPILGTNGIDGQPSPLTMSNFGAAGSDDITMTPGDPGYAKALTSIGSGAAVVGHGAYVDLAWGKKVLNALPYYSLDASNLPTRITTGADPGHYLYSPLSGFALPGTAFNSAAAPNLAVLDYADSLYRSGKVLRSNNANPPVLCQPTYDTWTTRYESDGITEFSLTSPTGAVIVDGTRSLYDNSITGTDDTIIAVSSATEAYRRTVRDPGSDGIDNNGSGGIDEITEQETSPPFPFRLRGVKVSVRMEDKSTRQVRQMSVGNEALN